MARFGKFLAERFRFGSSPMADADRDLIALGIAVAAIIMFVGTGSTVVPQALRSLAGNDASPDPALTNALLLNIALIIFGWRRYRQLANEVRERRCAEEKARILAETDPLTGFLNRRSFREAIDKMIEQSSRQGKHVAVLMIDLDNFKQINDFNGHSIGDQVLLATAHRIEQTLPGTALLARMGGDEFACAMPFDAHRCEAVDEVAGAIVESVCEPTMIDRLSLEVTASVGVARSDIGSGDSSRVTDAHVLLEMADIAMYQAKRQGRNCYYWFEANMAAEMRYRGEIETGIREGIENGEFVPYYEQQIDVQTGKVTGFEMLARWNSPKFGIVTPDLFIPIAEEIGAISQLSEGLIRQALADAKDWDTSLSLAVNISPLQLRDPWFSQRLLKLLVEANFPPDRIEIEITESCLHENVGHVRTLITSLKNQGIKVSLDDFGTGYSSLAQLRNLPFDRIKIDRSFVSELASNEDKAAIVHAIALLGQGLGLPVTAEGIETSEVLDHLRQYGAMKGQGYLYGRPRPAAETRQWLEAQGLLCEAIAEPDVGGTVSPTPSILAPQAMQGRRA